MHVQNIPVKLVLNDTAWYNKEIKNHLKELQKVKIVSYLPSGNFLDFINNRDKVVKWWYSKKVQNACENFLRNYCLDTSSFSNN